jgi:alpha-ketoglutarate-dependent taurine dioxygenase
MHFEPLDASFGTRVSGINVVALDDDSFNALYDRWLETGLLVLSGQHLDRAQQIAFAKRFGDLEFDIAEIGNLLRDGSLRPDDGTDDMMKVNHGNMGWHHDSTYMAVQAKGAVFTAEIVPAHGGATGFADMRAAYDALDAQLKAKISNLRAHHSLYHSQAKVGHDAKPGASAGASVNADDKSGKTYGGYGFHNGAISIRPLVKTHPETGAKNLLVGRHAYDIIGMDTDESETLLKDLVEFACQGSRTYHHQWEPGDVVVWDNRRLMHQATPWPFTQPRRMWHSRIAGNPETESALTA